MPGPPGGSKPAWPATYGNIRPGRAGRAAAETPKGQMTMSRAAGKRPPYETIHPETIGRLRLLAVNGIGIDLDGHRVFADGNEIVLPRKEYELLRTLLENAGRALTRRELLDRVWGTGYLDRNKTLEVHIRRLRRKIDPQSRSPRIRTVRGLGYVLDVETAQLTRTS